MKPPAEPSEEPPAQAPIGRLERATVLALLLLSALYVSRPIWTIDPFWQMAVGGAFINAGEILQTDVFSAVDPSRPWRSFQVGYELLAAGLDRLGGLPLMRLVHGGVIVSALGLFFWGIRRRVGLGGLLSIVTLSALMVLFEDRFSVRAHVFNLLGWALLLPILLRGPGALKREHFLWTAAIMTGWGFLHTGGAFVFALASLAFPIGAAFESWVLRDGRGQIRPALLLFGCAFLPLLLAPNALDGIVQASSALDAVGDNNPEFRPTWHYFEIAVVWGHWVCGAFPLLVASTLVALGGWCLTALLQGRDAFAHRLKQVGATNVALASALAVASIHSARFAYLALFAMIALLPGLRAWFAHRIPRRLGRDLLIAALLGFLAVGWQFHVSAQAGSLPATVARNFLGSDVEEARFPTLQAEFLRGTGFVGSIHCQPNWGGYLLWRLSPHATVTADGRGSYDREVNDTLAFTYDIAHMRTAEHGPAVDTHYRRYNADAVVHQHPVWPEGFVPDESRWTFVFADPRGAIWVRRDTENGRRYLAALERLQKTHSDPSPP